MARNQEGRIVELFRSMPLAAAETLLRVLQSIVKLRRATEGK